MPFGNIPSDIILSILDQIPLGSPKSEIKSQAANSLRTCSLLSRAWRPAAQKRLLKKIILLDPEWVEQQLVLPPDWREFDAHPQRPLAELLDTMRDGSDWAAYIQVLYIRGRWATLDPHFPEILHILAEYGELRSLNWGMECASRCTPWYDLSEGFQGSVKAVLSSQKLTSIRLPGACAYFPFEIVGTSPLKHLELLGGHGPDDLMARNQAGRVEPPILKRLSVGMARVESLHLTGDSSRILSYYSSRQDFCLDFSHLKELSIEYTPAEFIQILLKCASDTLSHFHWTYEACYVRGANITDLWDIHGISLKALNNLRTLSIDAKLDEFLFYYHLDKIILVLEQWTIPSSLETINLAIELNAVDVDDAGGDDNKPLARLKRAVEEIQLDSKLAKLCSEAKSGGNLRKINMSILIRKWLSTIEGIRQEIKDDYEELTRATEVEYEDSDGSTIASKSDETSSKHENAGQGVVEIEWSDEVVERNCRRSGHVYVDGNGGDAPGRFLARMSLPRRIANLFPSLEATGMLQLEVCDYHKHYLDQPARRDIW